MPRRLGLASTLALAAALIVALAPGASGAGSGQSASLPGLPNLPHIPKFPKPQESATFQVVVEGEATDNLTSQLSGKTATCLFTEDGHVKETTTYRRGKGVKLQFDRYGGTVLIHRAGRKTDATLAVQLANKRTATGGSSASPVAPPLPCDVPPYELSQNPDCGKVINDDGKMVFTYGDDKIKLSVTRTGTNAIIDNECGSDPQTGLPAQSAFGWPNVPRLEPGHLALKQVFGHKRHFTILLRYSDVGARKKRQAPITAGPFKGNLDEEAFNEATVRLTRVKSK